MNVTTQAKQLWAEADHRKMSLALPLSVADADIVRSELKMALVRIELKMALAESADSVPPRDNSGRRYDRRLSRIIKRLERLLEQEAR